MKKKNKESKNTGKKFDDPSLSKKEKKTIKKEKKQDSIIAERNLVSDIAPIIAGNEANSYFILEDGTLMDFYRIVCKDLINVSSEILNIDNLTWDKFHKTNEAPVKIVGFNFPTDTKQQLDYAKYILSKTENPVFKRILNQRIIEDIWINENRTDKEFCLFFYAKNEDMLREKRANIYGILSGSAASASLVERLDYSRKIKILYKLFNPIENL